jgi:PAS domain S-box-containing protein
MLVVDDDDVDRERVRRLLAASPLETDVEEAASGAEALRMVKARAFDCVVLDNQLGDASGAELLPQLHRQACRDCPIIMVTGAGSETLAARVMLEGAADYLAKAQLDVDGLVRSIRRSMEHHRLQGELEVLRRQLEQRVEEQAATIRQRERDLQALVDNAPTVMGYWDRSQCCRFGNPTHGDWFGIDPQQLQGKTLREVLGKEPHAAIAPRIEAALSGQTQRFEWTVPARAGRPARHAQVQLRPDLADDGGVPGFYATMTDVTPIKAAQGRAEELLRFSEAVIENSPIGIAVFRAGGACVVANTAFVDVLGEDFQALYRSDFRLRPAWRSCGLVDEALATLDDGLTRRLDVALPVPRGGAVQLACALARVDRGGEPHLLLLGEDITERRQALEALVAARDAAETAARTKSAFLANMSHEIRTPMNAIVGLSRLALEDELPPVAREYLDKVHTSAVALMGVLDDVLDYSKIEAGYLHFEHIRFDPEETLQRVADLFQARIEQKALAFSVELSPRAPRHVKGDPLRLSQVLTNLVGNAVKFTEAGRIHVKVDVVEEEPAGETCALRFSVSDTGIGIAADRQAALFEAFVQGDESITRHFGGTGLGLAICKSLVQMMGGAIGVDSHPGEGSEFWFTARFDSPADPAADEEAPDVVGRRVLVVDGNPLTRRILVRQLRSWGVVVTMASDVDSALAQVDRLRRSGLSLHALLVDHEVVRAQGSAALLRRSTEGRPPAFLVMMNAGERDAFLHGQTHPADVVLIKPVLASRLLEALHRSMGEGQAPGVPNRAGGSPQARSDALRAMAAPLHGARVLLAEDNRLNQIVAAELLRRAGLEVTVVDDGAQAVAALRESPGDRFAAVLMDLHMPVLDGLEATRRICAQPGGMAIPIIGMTAAALPEDRARCIEAGMVDHIPKPVIPEHVIRVLLRWVVRGPEAPLPSEPASATSREAEHAGDGAAELDLAGLRDRLHGNETLVWKLLAAFVEQEADAGQAVGEMMARGDTEGVRLKVHDLKGSAANLGAVAISAASAALEETLKKGMDADAALARLQQDLQASLNVIRAIIARQTDSAVYGGQVVDAGQSDLVRCVRPAPSSR